MSAPEITITHAYPRLRVDEAALRRLIDRVVAGEACTVDFLGIVLSDHATVHRLNAEYLGHDYETDVLSFALNEAEPDAEGRPVIDGEVYVDLDTAEERAPEFGTTFEEEARRYVVHGLLHLIGYDDQSAGDRLAMRRLEDRYLAACRP